MAAFTNAWDVDSPKGGDIADIIDNKMRDHRVDLSDRLKDQFYGFDASDNTGAEGEYGTKHLKLYPQTSPTADADYGFLFSKTADSEKELHYLNGSDEECQITKAGKLNISGNIPADSVDEDDIQLANDAYLEALNAAGTGTVNLIKANTSDSPVIPNGAELHSSDTPSGDAKIVPKKYVDDQIAAIGGLFGTWSLKSNNQQYTATTDGIVCAYSPSSGGASQELYGETPVGTKRQHVKTGAVYSTSPQLSITFPVRKGDTWKVVGASNVYWLPIGG